MADAAFRSPAWQPLTDLRNKVQFDKHHPRPYFGWSSDGAAESREDAPPYVVQEWPKLVFQVVHGTIRDRTVRSVSEQEQAKRDGWVETYPVLVPVAPLVAIQAELDALSPEDRLMVIEAQRQERIKALTTRMATLGPDALATLVADAEPKRTTVRAR